MANWCGEPGISTWLIPYLKVKLVRYFCRVSQPQVVMHCAWAGWSGTVCCKVLVVVEMHGMGCGRHVHLVSARTAGGPSVGGLQWMGICQEQSCIAVHGSEVWLVLEDLCSACEHAFDVQE